MNTFYIGELNGHMVGYVLKEVVRRAMVAIRSERFIFEAQAKEGYGGNMDDVFTSADTKAQRIYLRTLMECFPKCGIIAEEDLLKISPSLSCKAYFTLDPLDGTKAFIRRQSHGVGTMIALVDNGKVICAYVGDINTEEIYGYRPGSHKVHRITRLDTYEQLVNLDVSLIKDSHILLRDPLKLYSPLSQSLINKYKSHDIEGGSIGTWMARLWKREVKAVLMLPGWETPWDSTPVTGISQMLGYVFLRPNALGTRWETYEPQLYTEKTRRKHDVLVVHLNEVIEVLAQFEP